MLSKSTNNGYKRIVCNSLTPYTCLLLCFMSLLVVVSSALADIGYHCCGKPPYNDMSVKQLISHYSVTNSSYAQEGNEITICTNQKGFLGVLITQDIDDVEYCDTSGCFDCEPADALHSLPGVYHVSWNGEIVQAGDYYATEVISSTPGDYKVTCTISDEGYMGCPDSPVTVEFTVHVIPLSTSPPECKDTKCNTNTGGGCGTCSTGGGRYPLPEYNCPDIRIIPCEIAGTCGPGGGDGGELPADPSETCKAGQIEQHKVCGGGVYLRAWDCSGKCYVSQLYMPLAQVLFPVGDDCYIGSVDENSIAHVRKQSDNTLISFNNSVVGYPATVQDSSQNTTTYNREVNGTLKSIHMPNGEMWQYEHTLENINGIEIDFSRLMTKATAPDFTRTELDYKRTSSSDKDNGKLQTVVKKDTLGVEVSTTSLSYDSTNGNLLSFIQSVPDGASRATSRVVKYNYDIPNQIAVDECDPDNDSIVLARTVYWYGQAGGGQNEPAANETWIIRKGLLQGEEDQVTKYVFDTSTGKRTNILSVTDPEGNTTSHLYDTKDRVTETTAPNGTKTIYTYNPNTGAVDSVENKLDTTTLSKEEYFYYNDASGNPTTWLRTQKDVRGNFTHYERNVNSLWRVDKVKTAPAAAQEPDWSTVASVKEYQYWELEDSEGIYGMPGQLKREIVPGIDGSTAQITKYIYKDSTGKMHDSPVETLYQYWNDATSSYVEKSNLTTFDSLGRVASTADAEGKTVSYEYDNAGRQTFTIYKWDGATKDVYTQNEYSPCCGLIWSRDENGNKTYYGYDALKRVERTWTDIQGDQNSTNSLVTYQYDSFGNKKKVTTYSAAGVARETSYTYDKNNRVTKIVYPYDGVEGDLVGTEEFKYDAVGRLVLKKDGNGTLTAYQYDDLGRLTGIDQDYQGAFTLPLGQLSVDVTYGYEGNSSLRTLMIDSSGTSEYTYDFMGRLESYTPPQPSGHAAVTYTYNNLGQKTSVTSGSYNVSYDYYANGWLKDVKRGTESIAHYDYDAVGNRKNVSYGNGTSIDYDDDDSPRYMTTSITHKKETEILAQIGYPERDDVGNPERITDWVGGWNFGYDSNNRLISAKVPDLGVAGKPAYPVPEQPAGGDYGYDWVGNRLNPPAGVNAMVYDAADRLTLWPGMYSYTYFGDGSMKEVKNPAGTTTLRSYTYNDDGLLSGATYAGRSSTFTWDADRNRVGMTMSGDNYSFVYDTTAGIPAVIEEVTPGGSVFYIREPGGELIARVDGSDIRYYHFDELGSTRMLTDGTGTVTDRYVFDAWGNTLSHTGSTDQPYQYVGRLGYYTHHQDPEFALMQLGVRFYDAQVGRFTQRDPAKSAINDYIYSKDHPVMNVDPSGLFERVGCDKKGCKALDKWINEVKQKLYKNQSCRTAIDKAGIECLKFFEDNIKDMVLYCDDLSKTREEGYCRSKGAIHIDCNKSEPAGTIMHEMTHACFWDKESKGEIPPPNQAPGHKCTKKGCYRVWAPGEGDPVWEGAAEDVRHACGW